MVEAGKVATQGAERKEKPHRTHMHLVQVALEKVRKWVSPTFELGQRRGRGSLGGLRVGARGSSEPWGIWITLEQGIVHCPFHKYGLEGTSNFTSSPKD